MHNTITFLTCVFVATLLSGCGGSDSPFTEGGSSSTNIISDLNFGVGASEPNPAVLDDDGFHGSVEVELIATAGDRQNRKVTSGTVYFRSEYGLLSANSCNLGSTGQCSVTWTSILAGIPVDLLAGITVYTMGEESYLDADGSGNFSDGDTQLTDTDEPYVDYNANWTFDFGIDVPIDLDNSRLLPLPDGDPANAYTYPDGKISVSGCVHSSLCAEKSKIYIYDQMILILDQRTPVPPALSATIITPATPGSVFTSGSSIQFVVSATDPEDGTINGPADPLPNNDITWASDLDGSLGSGSDITTTALVTLGIHTITVTVTDDDSNVITATTTVDIQ